MESEGVRVPGESALPSWFTLHAHHTCTYRPGTGFVARTAAESPLNAAHDTMGGPAPTDKWHSYAKTKTGGLAFCNDRTMFTSPGTLTRVD